MALLVDVGALVGAVLVALVALSAVSPQVNRVLSRVSLAVFRRAVERQGRNRQERKRLLQATHRTVTYPVYASKTLLYSGLLGVAGSLIAVWVIQTVLVVIVESEQMLRSALPPDLAFLVPTNFASLSAGQVFVLTLASTATFGTLGGGLTYYLRWWSVRSEANKREILIDESVARSIAFIYALSRSGMVFAEIMRTVADNRKAFGESAEEIGVVVKDMDLFGADLVTALERIANRTPSDQFADFAENFANVLETGRNVSQYLREQYDQYQTERLESQERLLELFTALGEGYVAVLVAGPLFLLTILLIFGILTGGMLEFIQLIVYVLIPLANVGFVVYLGSIAEPLTTYQAPIQQVVDRRKLSVRRADAPDAAPAPRADGGAAAVDAERNLLRLEAFNRFRRFHAALIDPVETVISNPFALLYVTVPVTVVATLVRAWPMIDAGAVDVRVLDDILIQSGLFLVGTFAVAQELHSRQIREIESAIPDLLDRLASTNEAGMTFTESLRRIDRSDLGSLNVEIERLIADIHWGGRTETALHRMNDRVGSSTVARIVALITNAMSASGNLGPVIRIAADEAREDRRLRTKRRQEMFMYVLIIYLSFFVFLGIGIALQTILIPAIPNPEELSGVASGGPIGLDLPINPVQGPAKGAYTLVLYHAAIVQAVCSGFVAGQMGEGKVANGAKHVTIMLAVAYVLFVAFG